MTRKKIIERLQEAGYGIQPNSEWWDALGREVERIMQEDEPKEPETLEGELNKYLSPLHLGSVDSTCVARIARRFFRERLPEPKYNQGVWRYLKDEIDALFKEDA